jgi:tetratricopeptide (TPR) repeat protein
MFSDPVKVGGQLLEAGTYALYIRPGAKMWELFFYTETENWGIPQNWDANAIATVVELPTEQLAEKVESFTISIDDLNNEGANINIRWEQTQVSLALEVPTDSKTMASIEKTMNATPKAGDMYQAAVYYRESGRDLQKAKAWISKAIELDPDKYWMYRQQALILGELNEKDAAINAAKTSLELAIKAGNQDYVRLNEKSIAEWSK